tara:strand:+ start:465 stop:707 length:243 start_codon:yes stop_codon:yes gene_type:complete
MIRCKECRCPVKTTCKRFSDKEQEEVYLQEPYDIEGDRFTCDMYWGDTRDRIFIRLNETSYEHSKRTSTSCTKEMEAHKR